MFSCSLVFKASTEIGKKIRKLKKKSLLGQTRRPVLLQLYMVELQLIVVVDWLLDW